MRRTTISHFSFERNFQTQSKDNMPTSQGNMDPIIARSDQHSPSPAPKRPCEITIISFSRSICRGELAALIGVTGKPYPSCLSCHSHPIRPCGHLPLEGKAIKLSGRTFLAPHRGSCPKGLCKRTGFLGVKRRENPVKRHFERSEMRGLRSGIA